MIQWARDGRRFLPAVLIWGVLCAPAASAPSFQDTSIETFEEVDPYTHGERELLDRLGYVSLGPFPWVNGHTSEDLRETLGGVSVIFIETEHFRIASSLRSYKRGGDRVERALLKDEYARFKKRIGKFKPGRETDPWLRAHLYAQRLEALYADFRDLFEFEDGEFADKKAQEASGIALGAGPYLGQKEKFTVLLCEQRSGLGRYVTRYMNATSDAFFRWRFSDSVFLGMNFERLKDIHRKLDLHLHLSLTGCMVLNFVDGFRQSGHHAPPWFKYGLAHFYTNRIDPRWPNWGAGGSTNPETDRLWEWEPRVRGLVANGAATSWDAMLAWRTADDLKPRDHMLAWSRVRWLIEQKPEGLRELILGLTEPIEGSTPEELAKAAVLQQQRAFERAYGATAAELEAEWQRHVRRRYSK